jgi:hypothetical protein
MVPVRPAGTAADATALCKTADAAKPKIAAFVRFKFILFYSSLKSIERPRERYTGTVRKVSSRG